MDLGAYLTIVAIILLAIDIWLNARANARYAKLREEFDALKADLT